MRKFTLLLSLLVSLCAAAQVSVQVSTDTEKHYYKIASAQGSSYFITTYDAAFKTNNVEAATFFTFEAVDGEEDVYYIKSATYDAYATVAASTAGTQVKWKQGTPTDAEKWKLKTRSTNNNQVTFIAYATKDEADGDQLGWNTYGGLGNLIKLYGSASGNAGTYWTLVEKNPPTAPDFTPVKASEITDGWYQIRVVQGYNGDALTAGKYVQDTPMDASWALSLHAANDVSSTFFYFEKNEADGRFAIKNSKGQYITANGRANSTPVYPFTFNVDNDGSGASDDGSGTKILIKGTSGSTTYQMMGWYNSSKQSVFVGVSSTGNFPGKSFEISRVSDEYLAETYDIYNVESLDFAPIHGGIGVQYNATDNNGAFLALPGSGVFFVRKDKTGGVQNSDFSLNNGTGGSRDNHFLYLDVDVENHKINITQTLTASAEDVLNLSEQNLVGFPTEGLEEPNATLRAALELAQNEPTAENLTALETAYTTWKTDVAALTADIVMPEDGKAYYLRSVQQRLPKSSYLANNASGELVLIPFTAEKDLSAVFVCHKVGEKYIFTNAAKGNYMVWRGKTGGYNDNKGYSTDYVESNCLFQLISQASARPGSFRLLGKRGNGTSDGSFIVSPDGAFDAYNNSNCWQADFSTAFVLEEVKDYGMNRPALKAPATADGYEYASLYLPYATTIPEGVSAFTATRDGDELTLVRVEGATLPKNTAAVLAKAADAADSPMLFVPAIEPGTASSDNVLSGTVEANTATPADAYVLTGKFGPIGFYKYIAESLPLGKAYLVASDVPVSSDGVQGMRFAMGGATGIGTLVTDKTPAACYDLSGRRVASPAKGGIYVKNGKKIIVK